jgi:hypothetical protein
MNELPRVNGQRATLPTIIGQAPARFPIGGKIRAGIKALTQAAARHPEALLIYEETCLSRALPRSVVHRPQALAATREDPGRVETALRLNDGPGGVVQNYHVGAFGLERVGWDHERASAHFGNANLPRPFQTAHIALA